MVTTNWRRAASSVAPISPIDPVPGRMNRTPPADPSPAIVLNRAIERVNVDGEHPSWSAMSPRVKPKSEGLSEPRILICHRADQDTICPAGLCSRILSALALQRSCTLARIRFMRWSGERVRSSRSRCLRRIFGRQRRSIHLTSNPQARSAQWPTTPGPGTSPG